MHSHCYYRHTKRPNIINFFGIMVSKNRLNLTNLCNFIQVIKKGVFSWLTVFLCTILYILCILYIVVSMSSLYLCNVVMRIMIYIEKKPMYVLDRKRADILCFKKFEASIKWFELIICINFFLSNFSHVFWMTKLLNKFSIIF